MTDNDIDKEISKRMNILTPYFLMVDSLTDSQLSIIKLEAKNAIRIYTKRKTCQKWKTPIFQHFQT